MSEPRIVHCKKLGKDLPGLARPPYKNDLGKRIYEEISKEAWDMWVKDSVKFVNTYFGQHGDLATPEGLKFMMKQAAIYFGFEDGEMAKTAFTPVAGSKDPHAGHDHGGHEHGGGEGHDDDKAVDG